MRNFPPVSSISGCATSAKVKARRPRHRLLWQVAFQRRARTFARAVRTKLFGDLDGEALARVLALGRVMLMNKGDVALAQDARCDHFYLIQSGIVSFQKSSASGLVFELGQGQAGGFFGEQVLLGDHPSEVQVVAMGPSSVCAFRAHDFRAVLGQYPAIARRTAGCHGRRVESICRLSFELATMKLKVRLRRIIRDLAQQSDQLL